MNSVQLLNWLVGVWEKVVYFFQTLYALVVWLWSNFFTWVSDLVIQWYENAINWAAFYLNILRDDASTWFEEAKAQALANLLTLLEYLLEIINNVREWVTNKRIELRDYLLVIISDVVTWVLARYDSVLVWIDNANQFVSDIIVDLVSWVITQKDNILDLVALLGTDNRRMLLQALFDNVQTILLFISNPLKFIFDIIYNKILDLLADALADGLGSVDATIPPRNSGY